MVAGNPRHTLKFKLDIIEPYMEKSLLKKQCDHKSMYNLLMREVQLVQEASPLLPRGNRSGQLAPPSLQLWRLKGQGHKFQGCQKTSFFKI